MLACGAGGAAAQSRRSSAATAHLYWANLDYDTIVEANLNGMGAKTVAQTVGPSYVAVSSSHLFWSTGDSSQTCSHTGTIVEADLNGSGAKAIVKRQPGSLNGVAVGGGHLYWAIGCAGTIVEAKLNGTGAKTIAKRQTPVGVAADSSHLYWTNRYSIVEAKLNGTGTKTIAKTAFPVVDVAVGGGHLYWSGFTKQLTGKIVEANLNGTGAKTIATVPDGILLEVAVGGGHLYWSDAGHGTIAEANLNGTGAKTIVTNQRGAAAVAVGP